MRPRHGFDGAVGLRRAEVPHAHIALGGLTAFDGVIGAAIHIGGVHRLIRISDKVRFDGEMDVVGILGQLTIEQHDSPQRIGRQGENASIRRVVHGHLDVDELIQRVGDQVLILVDFLLTCLNIGQDDFRLAFQHYWYTSVKIWISVRVALPRRMALTMMVLLAIIASHSGCAIAFMTPSVMP